MVGTQNFSKKKPEVERLHINLARLKKNGRKFEIVIDPDMAVSYKDGKVQDIREVLIAERIFEDVQKGIVSPKTDIDTVFPKMEVLDIAKLILIKGELQLSAKYRDEKQAEKRRLLVELIHRNGIDPKNNLPHPTTRILNALAEANVRIDDKKSAEDQVQDIVKKLQKVLPIRFEHKYLQIHLNEKYAKKYFKTIHSYGKVTKESWLSDGCYFCVIEVPAGLYTDLIDDLNKKTHGGVEIKLLNGKNG
ncbi:MAG: ribosome assembly factor SBDS [Candidatus Woesearchaeota archaeon]